MAGQPKRILLTGGAGFIGSHVVEALLRMQARLTIVDNLDDFYSPSWKKTNPESIRKIATFDFFDQDICAMDSMRETVARVQPDAIIHLAARAGVRPSIEHPRLYEHVNVSGTVNLLELCREFHVSRLIFGSSSSVYGASNRTPFSEEQSDLRPISPYACRSPKVCPLAISTAYSVAIHKRNAVLPSDGRRHGATHRGNPSPFPHSSHAPSRKSGASSTTRSVETETFQTETGGVR